MTWVPVACAAVAAALAFPARPVLRVRGATAAPSAAGWLHRHRLLWSGLAGLGAFLFLQGPVAPVAGAAAAVATWTAVGRAEPADVRRRRAEVRRDLPHVVELFAATLRGGAAPGDGVAVVAAALPGAAADRLAPVAARLSLGLDPVQVWEGLAADPELGRLGRALARAHASGAPVVASMERLADDLARAGRAETEDRARAVGVKAALPLGLCLLPAFVLVGIVPLVVALLTALDL
ncbi:type II secretion system F family protein [Nocardioides aquiterrae]|uniref:Type II secretion system protein GspF domain-containing protein n=1 Tax=Nocardioides aquiterrae TaxID=203799 RepID=A0ABP4EY45_9ACTN